MLWAPAEGSLRSLSSSLRQLVRPCVGPHARLPSCPDLPISTGHQWAPVLCGSWVIRFREAEGTGGYPAHPGPGLSRNSEKHKQQPIVTQSTLDIFFCFSLTKPTSFSRLRSIFHTHLSPHHPHSQPRCCPLLPALLLVEHASPTLLPCALLRPGPMFPRVLQ